MLIVDDARILLRMLRGHPTTGSHQENLAAFYGPQAASYDSFRERLLHGRAQMLDLLAPAPGSRLCEMGCGTGRNLEYLGAATEQLAAVELVDLCKPLLEIAKRRTAHLDNVCVIEGDATTYRPSEQYDAIYFAYALTMIPDWKAAIDNALEVLKPGGRLGVVDFFISAALPAGGRIRHSRLSRLFWRNWFRHDGVHLSPDHIDYLRERMTERHLSELRGPVPYLPLAAPYYIFIGDRD
ncbi:MAG: class I SAM-dependent methyltransferase [Pseudomonadota bacterium]